MDSHQDPDSFFAEFVSERFNGTGSFVVGKKS
jgi:hypothetical protein